MVNINKILRDLLKRKRKCSYKSLDDSGELVYSFDSIKDCAFNVHSRTIIRRVEKGGCIIFGGNFFDI
jgi:hypothetical protein